jgi:hypothetical protein
MRGGAHTEKMSIPREQAGNLIGRTLRQKLDWISSPRVLLKLPGLLDQRINKWMPEHPALLVYPMDSNRGCIRSFPVLFGEAIS